MITGRILLAIDGEPHTREAMRWALELGEKLGLVVVGVHVKDPYLKQFYNEIYAQGREEYLDHLDNVLGEKATRTVEAFETMASSSGVKIMVKVLEGDPVEVLAREVRDPCYRIIVLGRKHPTGRLEAWRSRDLPKGLSTAIHHLPVMLVPG